MNQLLKLISQNRNVIILGALLGALPVLLVLSQTHQVFSPQAAVNAPAVTGITGVSNSAGTGYPPGQVIPSRIAVNTNTGHIDAYYIKSDTRPTVADTGRFVEIEELKGIFPNGDRNWAVPNDPGHYWFAVNAHKIPATAHGLDDWNPAAGDIGCAWDGKIYETGTPLRDTGDTCTNVGLKEFWVGVTTSPSPSPSTSPQASPSAPASIAPRPSRDPEFVPSFFSGECLQADLGCLPKDPVKLTSFLYTAGLGLVGGVGVLFMVIGAYLVLTSQGDPTQLARGKSYIVYSIIGILLAIFGYAFYQIITVDILKLPGFGK